MVLADDNFTSIVAAVKEGRRVWDNIVRLLMFNLPVSAGSAVCRGLAGAKRPPAAAPRRRASLPALAFSLPCPMGPMAVLLLSELSIYPHVPHQVNFAQGIIVLWAYILGFHESPLTVLQASGLPARQGREPAVALERAPAGGGARPGAAKPCWARPCQPAPAPNLGVPRSHPGQIAVKPRSNQPRSRSNAQILLVNMVTSVILGMALAAEPAEPDVMDRPPRPANKRLIGARAEGPTALCAAWLCAAARLAPRRAISAPHVIRNQAHQPQSRLRHTPLHAPLLHSL